MKTFLPLLAISILLIFQSCTKQTTREAVEKAINEKMYASFSGKVNIKETFENSYLILINTTNSTDSYDKAIVVTSETPLIKPNISASDTYTFFIPENKRYIVIYNHNTTKISIIGLNDNLALQSISKFKSNSDILPSIENSETLGYGLSYLRGLWNMRKTEDSKYKNPFNILGCADMLKPDAPNNLPPIEDEENAKLCELGTCTSGGAGSTSCSISEPAPAMGCTVSCSAGYYACCRSSDVRCFCCKIN